MNRRAALALLPILAITAMGFIPQRSKDIDRDSYEVISYSDFSDLSRMDAYIVGNGGENLGEISKDKFGDSLANEYGKGSQYSSNGLFNPYSKYGDKSSDTSAYNEHANKPPLILVKKGGKIYTAGIVTKNKYASTKGKRVDPDGLKGWMRGK